MSSAVEYMQRAVRLAKRGLYTTIPGGGYNLATQIYTFAAGYYAYGANEGAGARQRQLPDGLCYRQGTLYDFPRCVFESKIRYRYRGSRH